MFTALPFLQVYCLNVTDSERYTVKCKCGPVAWPVLPESPTTSPVEIDCPFWTLMLERCAYRVARPLLCLTSTHFPYWQFATAPWFISATVPKRTAFTGVPTPVGYTKFFVLKSTPSCVPEAYNRTESNVFPNCCVMDIESSGHCSTPLFGVGICDESAMPS